MQNLIGVNGVDLANERLVRRDTELMWFDRDGILPGGTSRVGSHSEIGNKLPHLDYGQDEHPDSSPRGQITSSHWSSALHRGKQRPGTHRCGHEILRTEVAHHAGLRRALGVLDEP